MKILAIYRHYWPDATPYARILKFILEEQARNGHQVRVLTAQPSYNDIEFPRCATREYVEGVEVVRCSLFAERKHWRVVRLLNSMLFLAWAIWKSLGCRNYQVVIANTHPPILMGLALQAIKFLSRVPYILHCQDIHPESLAMAGQLKSRWLLRLLKSLDTASCRRAQLVVTLSADMKQTLLRRDCKLDRRIVILNNFSLDSPRNLWARVKDGELFQLIFAGNMGHFQGLDRLVEAMGLLGDELPVELVFLGTGSEVGRLRELASNVGNRRIRFVEYQSPHQAARWIRDADLGVVSLAEGVCQVAYPSKTMAYAAAGCPILSIVEQESQVACDVERLELGYVPGSVSAEGIAEAIRVAWHDRHRWTAEARRALSDRAEREFGVERAMDRWE